MKLKTIEREQGGICQQIENIARKTVTEEIFMGSMPCLERIMEFCREESLDTNPDYRVMGYMKKDR